MPWGQSRHNPAAPQKYAYGDDCDACRCSSFGNDRIRYLPNVCILNWGKDYKSGASEVHLQLFDQPIWRNKRGRIVESKKLGRTEFALRFKDRKMVDDLIQYLSDARDEVWPPK